MFEVSFTLNGRKVNPNNIGDALESAFLKEIQDSMKKRVGAIRCPEHGRAAKIVAQGRKLSDLSFKVSGGCDSLIDRVTKKLK